MSDESCEIEVDSCEPNHIEVIVNEYQPPRPTVCRMWDKVKHRRTDEFNQQFLADHPECR
ncbi:MAG: hypothetical protein ACR2NF_01275 [Pirellulales bacterium]